VKIKILGQYWNLFFKPKKDIQNCYGICILPNQPCDTKGCTDETPCVLCASYKDRDIVIAQNLDPEDELGTVIHELMHAAFPAHKEYYIHDVSESITTALWRLGYRKKEE
jgi:Zn-dependent peptidase ImmA (M78 family)